MLKKISILLGVALVLLSVNPAGGSDKTDPARLEDPDISTLEIERIAVMPFWLGRLESPDNPVEKPLSLPLQQLNSGTAQLLDGAEQIMTRLVHNFLQIHYRDKMVPMETAASAYAALRGDQTLDTPRKLAVKFGGNLPADLVVFGTVWRFREKGVNPAGADSPASVAFAVYLVDVASGERLWRNAFDGTQKVLSEDVIGGLKQVKLGLRWLSATDLARLGVKTVFKKFPVP